MSVEVIVHTNGPFRQNCYIVSNGNGEAIIVDPGSEASAITEKIKSFGLTPKAIMNTHAHFDHVGAVAELMERYDVPFFLHTDDKQLLSQANLYKLSFKADNNIKIPEFVSELPENGGEVEVSSFVVTVFRTPGHTLGGVCLCIGENLFTGDTLFANGIGRTDLPGGDKESLNNSLEILSELEGGLIIWPGHGKPTTLKDAISNWRR